MAKEAPIERRLAAILAADIAGYRRLMGRDEIGTVRALKALRRELGEETVKNTARSSGVFGLGALDIAGLPEEALPEAPTEVAAAPAAVPEQQIRFCRAPDGVQLAYSSIGTGPPLVKTGNWMTHL